MADNVVKLRVDSNEYEGKIKRASEGLQALGRSLRDAGKTFAGADAKQVEFTRELGKMQTVSNTAKGKIAEMSAAFINLKSQYLQMTDAEKQSPIGQAMSKSLDQLKTRTIEAKRELESLNRELNETKMPDIGGKVGGGLFSGLGDKMSGALQVFAGNMLTKAAGAVASLGGEMVDMVQQGVELAKQGEGIRIAFERLGRGDILDGLREATHGTVTDIELMKAAVKFNDFKLPVEELGTMLAFAQQKAKDTGQSVDYMVDSIVTGLGRKSLMILDNLGLSATEVKDKMKETGDMTKAVGEIIREQMAKAGDYVETAADRAAQANVSLQNKMEELGRKFAPVEEASSQLWTSMKIGILDVIEGPLMSLLNYLNQASRTAEDIITGSLPEVGSNVDDKGNYIKRPAQKGATGFDWNNGTWKPGYSGAIYNSATGQTELSEVFVTGTRRENPKKQKGTTKTTKAEVEAVSGSIDEQTKLVQELQKAWRAAADDNSRAKIKAEIEEQQYLLDRMTGKEKFDPMKMGPIADLTGRVPTPNFTAGTAPVAPDEIKFSDSLKKYLDYMQKQQSKDEKKEVNLSQEMSKIVGGVSGMMSGLEHLGVELPQGLKDVMGGIQGMISILTSISTIISAIEAISAADTLIPFARGGIVRAAGGTIVGNSYSGDNLRGIGPGGQLYGLNAGEVVLNRAESGILASVLEGGIGNIEMVPIFDGEKCYLMINRWGERSSRGKLVFQKQ